MARPQAIPFLAFDSPSSAVPALLFFTFLKKERPDLIWSQLEAGAFLDRRLGRHRPLINPLVPLLVQFLFFFL